MSTIEVPIPRKSTIVRTKKWTTVRKHHLMKQPECQACGAKIKLNVHHIIPVHVDKSKETDPDNLITLCENPNTGYCHFAFGHLSLTWWKYDPDVVTHVGHHRAAIEKANLTQDARGRPIQQQEQQIH